jgi:hypothetical protein
MARNLVFILQGPTNHTKHREYSKSFARDRVGAALLGFRNAAGGLSLSFHWRYSRVSWASTRHF